MEIISGVERRRHWRVEDKLRMVAEAERPGACFAEVARRNEVSRSILWMWRKQVRQGSLVAEPVPMFMPMQVTADLPRLVPGAQAEPSGPGMADCATNDSRIEVVLPDGTVLRVGEDVGLSALRRVLSALRR
jgi:transposase